MTLTVDVKLARGNFMLECQFQANGRLTALFGPSGSGKSTVVDLIAGLAKPDRGRVEANGITLVDTERRIFVSPHKRGIGYVFQDARLFPHLSVSQNLRYGRAFSPKYGRYADLASIVALLGIGHLLERRPATLSGGERQRVAIGRALLASPRLILMDEPLSSLDEARKGEVLPYIERLRDEVGIPIVFVSHSVAEVARLASDVVTMSAGRVTASGPAADVLRRMDVVPADEGGALLTMAVARHDARYGLTELSGPAGTVHVPSVGLQPGTHVRVRVRARDVMIAISPPAGISALNALAGRIKRIDLGDGPHADVVLDCNGETVPARITRRSADDLGLTPGMGVFAILKSVGLQGAAAGAGET